jgi:hypothetical protein
MGILYLSVMKLTGILQNNNIAGENKAANWKIRFKISTPPTNPGKEYYCINVYSE